jgi:hypothetical protein
MSGLVGGPGERFALARVVDALGEAARQAGRPGFLWLAGYAYPSSLVSLGILWTALRVAGGGTPQVPLPVYVPQVADLDLLHGLAVLIAGLPLWLVCFRLVTGLAWVSMPDAWEHARGARRSPGIGAAWRAGRGVTWSGFGLWGVMRVLNVVALFIVLGPFLLLFGMLELPPSLIAVALFVPALFLVVYGTALEVLTQLALHSLAHNRRGVASAIQHAWRLVRVDPWASLRTTVVDLAVQLLLLTALAVLEGAACCMEPLVWLLYVLLLGFLGVARAPVWARK